jgi:hypothetical protein
MTQETFEWDPDRFDVLSWSDFANESKPLFHKPFAECHDQLGELRRLRPDAEGNVRIAGDLVVDLDVCVIVEGNLIVDGNITVVCDEGFGNFLFVTGNVEAKGVYLGDFPEMIVHGDLRASVGVIGRFGGDGGFLDVGGAITAPVLVSDSYFSVKVTGRIDAVAIRTPTGNIEGHDGSADAVEVLREDLVPHGEVDVDLLSDAIQNNERVLRS